MLRMFVFCLALFSWLPANPSYQRIKLDERYNTIIPKDKDPKTVLHYRIKPDKGLILDCEGFDFSAIRKLNDGKDPDRVHLLFSKSGLFDVVLNTKGETVIDASDVQLTKAGQVFAGFRHSDTIFLAIGTIKKIGNEDHLMTFWLGQIDVE